MKRSTARPLRLAGKTILMQTDGERSRASFGWLHAVRGKLLIAKRHLQGLE